MLTTMLSVRQMWYKFFCVTCSIIHFCLREYYLSFLFKKKKANNCTTVTYIFILVTELWKEIVWRLFSLYDLMIVFCWFHVCLLQSRRRQQYENTIPWALISFKQKKYTMHKYINTYAMQPYKYEHWMMIFKQNEKSLCSCYTFKYAASSICYIVWHSF